MLVLGERCLDDGITLPGPPQSFAPNELIEPFLNSHIHEGGSSRLSRRREGERKTLANCDITCFYFFLSLPLMRRKSQTLPNP